MCSKDFRRRVVLPKPTGRNLLNYLWLHCPTKQRMFLGVGAWKWSSALSCQQLPLMRMPLEQKLKPTVNWSRSNQFSLNMCGIRSAYPRLWLQCFSRFCYNGNSVFVMLLPENVSSWSCSVAPSAGWTEGNEKRSTPRPHDTNRRPWQYPLVQWKVDVTPRPHDTNRRPWQYPLMQWKKQ